MGGWHAFLEMHLTIPGQLDVMGAALPGLPVINIGFNQHVADPYGGRPSTSPCIA
jgi:acyl-homoserine-lactone acylase